MLLYLTLVCLTIGSLPVQCVQPEPAPRVRMLGFTVFDKCEGKDVANYSLVENWTRDQFCSWGTNVNAGSDLQQCDDKGRKAVNSLRFLTGSLFPAGAQTKANAIFLVTGGPLVGKYFWCRLAFTSESYLKKCSSVLGLSAVTTQLAEILISDKLDPRVLIADNNAYDLFRKSSSTICKGQGVYQ